MKTQPVMNIIIESAALYRSALYAAQFSNICSPQTSLSAVTLSVLVCYVCSSTGTFIMLDVASPVVVRLSRPPRFHETMDDEKSNRASFTR